MSVYKISLFVIPAPYQVRGKLRRVPRLCPCEGRELLKTGFPFSRLRAEALRRASTGMTKKEDYGIYGQTLIIYYYAIRHSPHGVHGSPEPYMVQGAFLNDSTGWSLKP